MPKMYLPFYDLGGAVYPDGVGNAIDVSLYRFLTARAWDVLKGKIRPSLPSGPTQIHVSKEWIGWWHQFFSLPVPSPCVIRPHANGPASLMQALNVFYYKHYPKEFVVPTFQLVPSGWMSANNLDGHMFMQPCVRSAWTGVSAACAGPVREAPFYDLSMPFGVGDYFPTVDAVLVTALMRLIYGAFSYPFTGWYIAPDVLVTGGIVQKFAADAHTAGWPGTGAETIMHPTGGSLSSPSLIRAMNHYALQKNRNGFLTLPHCTSFFSYTPLRAALATNQESLWF